MGGVFGTSHLNLLRGFKPPSLNFPAKYCFQFPPDTRLVAVLSPNQVLPSREGFREILELAAGAG